MVAPSLSAIDDDELLRRIGGGDIAAVGELYDRYATMALSLSLPIVRDRAEADDVVHDAFVAVVERARAYVRERGTVAVWLTTLVRNMSIDRIRRRHRRAALERDVIAKEPRTPVADPEKEAAEAADGARIHRALATLPPVLRETLESAYFEGLTYLEIAARHRVPVGTVKSRAKRAIASLRKAVKREGLSAA